MFYCDNCGNTFRKTIKIHEIFGFVEACPRCRCEGYIEECDEEENEED